MLARAIVARRPCLANQLMFTKKKVPLFCASWKMLLSSYDTTDTWSGYVEIDSPTRFDRVERLACCGGVVSNQKIRLPSLRLARSVGLAQGLGSSGPRGLVQSDRPVYGIWMTVLLDWCDMSLDHG